LNFQRIQNRVLTCTAACALLPVCGCQSLETPQQSSLLRVMDASANAPASNLLVNGVEEFANVSSPSISNYAPVNTGSSTLTVQTAGTTTGGIASPLDAEAGQEYSLLMLDQGTSYVTSIVADQSVAAPSTEVSLRFITNTPVAGALDIYMVPSGGTIAKATPVESHLVSGTVSAYVNLIAGDYDLIVTGAGSTVAKFTDTGLTFSSGQVRTLLLADQRYTKPAAVELVIGNDLN
jgi:hypothetical protein